jgi:hypothetical protein
MYVYTHYTVIILLCDMLFVVRHLTNMATMRSFEVIPGEIMCRTRIPCYVRDEFVTKQ